MLFVVRLNVSSFFFVAATGAVFGVLISFSLLPRHCQQTLILRQQQLAQQRPIIVAQSGLWTTSLRFEQEKQQRQQYQQHQQHQQHQSPEQEQQSCDRCDGGIDASVFHPRDGSGYLCGVVDQQPVELRVDEYNNETRPVESHDLNVVFVSERCLCLCVFFFHQSNLCIDVYV